MEKIKHREAQVDLMQVLGFNEYDLEANRKGLLSNGQRRKIQVEGYCAVLVLIAITTIGLAAGGLAIISGDRAQILGGFVIIAGMVVLPSVIAWWMSRHYNHILEKCEVRIMRGMIRKNVNPGFNANRSGFQFKIQMGSEEFPLSTEAFNAFVENREYYLYIAPHVKQILAAEPAMRKLP
jgi:hypothetical protein